MMIRLPWRRRDSREKAAIRRVETFRYDDIGDFWRLKRGLVLPWFGGRALRLGFYVEAWARVGPRRFRIMVAPRAVEDLADIAWGGDIDKTKDELREWGYGIEGDGPRAVK